jgi:hypothetical protein
MRERLAQLGLEVALNSPDEFVAVINADIAKWAKVIKDANIKLSEQKKMLWIDGIRDPVSAETDDDAPWMMPARAHPAVIYKHVIS